MPTKLDNKFADSLWRPMTQHAVPPKAAFKQFVRGEGCYLYDEAGTRHLDALAGLYCVNVGYGREEIATAAGEAMLELAYLAPSMACSGAIELADKLAELIGAPGQVYFSSSGSEANETAFKIARQIHAQNEGGARKYKIIARYRGYHGNTLGALSATGQSQRKAIYEPLAPGFLHTMPPYPYRSAWGDDVQAEGAFAASQLEEMIIHEGAETVAAVIMEPIISGGGIIIPPDNYLGLVRDVCDRHGVLLIFDEVVSGFGRTGKMFGFQHSSVMPDIMTFGKGLTSGYFPVGATYVRQELADKFLGDTADFKYFRQINTFGGHPVGMAVALANLRIVQGEQLTQNAQIQGDFIRKTLRDEIGDHPNVGDIRGEGLLTGVEFVVDRETKEPLSDEKMGGLVAGCFEDGVIVSRNGTTIPGRENVFVMTPPLCIQKDDAAIAANALIAQVGKL